MQSSSKKPVMSLQKVPGASQRREHALGWGWWVRGCCGGVCVGHPSNQTRLSANCVQKSVCADSWQRHPAADDIRKTVVPNACFASSQPPLCTIGGGRERGSQGSTGWRLCDDDGCIRPNGICWRVQKILAKVTQGVVYHL